MAQGLRQKHGIDHFDTYALVARTTTIRLLVALASTHNLVIHQMNVKIAFCTKNKMKSIWSNPRGLFWKHMKIRCVNLYSCCTDLKKHQNNGIKSLMRWFCPLDSNWIKPITEFIANSMGKETESFYASTLMICSYLVLI